MRVLIVRSSAIGDVVFASALPGAIRRSHSDAHIAWLVEPGIHELLLSDPDIDEVIPWSKAEWVRLWKSGQRLELWRRVRQLRRELHARRFDPSQWGLVRHSADGYRIAFGLAVPSPEARPRLAGSGDAVLLPYGLELIELLQFIREARGLAAGERPPPGALRVALCLTAWDEVQAVWRERGPQALVRRAAPLLCDFLWSNFAAADVFTFGLSATTLYFKGALEKLGVETRTAAAAMALQRVKELARG